MIFPRKSLKTIIQILLFLFLFFGGLYFAGNFLKPLSVAILICFVLLPVARWIEKKGASRLVSSGICTLIFLIFLGGIALLIGQQGQKFGEEYSTLKEKATEAFDDSTEKISSSLGLSQDELIQRIRQNARSGIKAVAQETISGVTSSTTDVLLILVYLFAFLFYRRHFKEFVLRVFKKEQDSRITEILEESLNAAIFYLRGKFILIGILAVIYSVGLWLIGIKFAIFYGVFAALLTLIPFIGNIIGGSLPVITALLYGDITSAYLVVALFVVVQFIESYILTPLIVGKEVDVHPIMCILVVVLGSAVWGIVGMMVSIPYLGMLRFLLGNFEQTKPYAFLLAEENEE